MASTTLCHLKIKDRVNTLSVAKSKIYRRLMGLFVWLERQGTLYYIFKMFINIQSFFKNIRKNI